MMTSKEFVAKAIDIANNYKTLYVMGCFGAALNDKGKARYTRNHSYNKRFDRTEKIKDASNDTFGFDCVGLIKGILWGWSGNLSPYVNYGGAAYKTNGVPDIGANKMIAVCRDVSEQFVNLVPGEVVWTTGHIGIYIGDGLVVECTPSWKDKVQITAVRNIGKKAGYASRTWLKHGKLPYVDYEEKKPAPAPAPEKPKANLVLEWQKAAIADGYKFPKYGADGEWGAECVSVAKSAVCKRLVVGYKNKNLTKFIQKQLGITADGLFGNNTRAAVIEYQRKNDLSADGAVGINTWKKILGVK